MMITTKDIKIKDQSPEKLVILSTNTIQPKEFVIKGKGKPKSDLVITTSNIKEKEKPLDVGQKKIVADIKAAKKAVADLTKENKKLKADAEKAAKKLEGKKK